MDISSSSKKWIAWAITVSAEMDPLRDGIDEFIEGFEQQLNGFKL